MVVRRATHMSLLTTVSSVTVMTVLATMNLGGIDQASAQEVIDGGTVVVPGTQNSPWTLMPPGFGEDTLIVGRSGLGTLMIQDNGEVRAPGNTTIGENTTSTGAIIVSGSGRLSTDGLNVGSSGQGVLIIQDGGVVDIGNSSSVAFFAGSAGIVEVTGQGSAWRHDINQLFLGSGGTGRLDINDRGLVTSVAATVGSAPEAFGFVTVTDGGSWENELFLVLGDAGTTFLTVSDGGVVSTGSLQIARDGRGEGALNVGAAASDAAQAPGTIDTSTITFGDGTGSITFNHTSENYAFGADINGTGQIKHLFGTTILGGNSSGFDGTTNVGGGDLRVNGRLGGTTDTDTGGTLSGTGTLEGAVNVADGGAMSPGDGGVGTLSIDGPLVLSEESELNFDLGTPDMVGGSTNDLIDVTGDLTLDGTLNITDVGGFGAGVYRLFNYGGDLTDESLEIGAVPDVVEDRSDLRIRTSIDNQIDLVSLVNAELGFWDGDDTDLYDNDAIDGGTGVWRADGRAWTDMNGAINGSFRPIPTFAVFQGSAGEVTVNNEFGDISVTGMQFMTDGYEIIGDSIALDGTNAILRVGDGTMAGMDMTATISSSLTGTAGLTKTDYGTLILDGENSYTGGTTVAAGTLQVGSDGSIGDVLVEAGARMVKQGAVGAITNSGRTEAQGTVNGPVVNNANGRFVVIGDLMPETGSVDVTNADQGVIEVSQGNFTDIGALDNDGLIEIEAGRRLAARTIDNDGTISLLGSDATLEGVELLANAGAINMRNDLTNNRVTTGDYSGGGSLAIDVNLMERSGDLLVINGDVMAGPTTMIDFNVVENGRLVNPMVIVDVNGNSPEGMFTGSAGRFGLYANDLVQLDSGDYALVSELDPVTDPSDLIALATASFFEPASGRVYAQPNTTSDPDRQVYLWTHLGAAGLEARSGGEVVTSGLAGSDRFGLTQDFDYYGVQLGADFAVTDIHDSGWDAHIGATAGFFDGRIKDNANAAYTDLHAPFIGAYAFISNGALTADFGMRHEFRQFDLTQQSIGLDQQTIDGHATTLSADLSYDIALGEGFTLTPHAGLNWTYADTDGYRYSDGRVETTSNTSLIGKAGATLSGDFALPRLEDTIVSPFAQINYLTNYENDASLTASAADTSFDIGATGPRDSLLLSIGASFSNDNKGMQGVLRGSWHTGGDLSGGAIDAAFRLRF